MVQIITISHIESKTAEHGKTESLPADT